MPNGSYGSYRNDETGFLIYCELVQSSNTLGEKNNRLDYPNIAMEHAITNKFPFIHRS